MMPGGTKCTRDIMDKLGEADVAILESAATVEALLELARGYTTDDPMWEAALKRALCVTWTSTEAFAIYDVAGDNDEIRDLALGLALAHAQCVEDAYRVFVESETEEDEERAFRKVLTFCETKHDVELLCLRLLDGQIAAMWAFRNLLVMAFTRADLLKV